jgi:hypothetical protein
VPKDFHNRPLARSAQSPSLAQTLLRQTDPPAQQIISWRLPDDAVELLGESGSGQMGGVARSATRQGLAGCSCIRVKARDKRGSRARPSGRVADTAADEVAQQQDHQQFKQTIHHRHAPAMTFKGFL